ncbi:hypothetical protein CFP56_003150 [Quercus suber]|uniref:Uncharacterized protein n=1 Tax=Quercus suber TaxID=58331 RepID=A0AAW0LEJ0_QUESU
MFGGFKGDNANLEKDAPSVEESLAIVAAARTNFNTPKPDKDHFIPNTPIPQESKVSTNFTNSGSIKADCVPADIVRNDDDYSYLNYKTCQAADEPHNIASDNDTIGNFPSPTELANLDEGFLASRCNLGYRGNRIWKLARDIVEGRIQLTKIEEANKGASFSKSSNYYKLAKQLKEIDAFGTFTSANVLMSIKVDCVPADIVRNDDDYSYLNCKTCQVADEPHNIASNNDTIGNFPSPTELANLDEGFLASRCNLGYRGSRIWKLARDIVEGRIQLTQLEEASKGANFSKSSNYDKLAKQLKEIDGFGTFTYDNVLMSELWHFYEKTFGKLSEMPCSDYKLITASNMGSTSSTKKRKKKC